MTPPTPEQRRQAQMIWRFMTPDERAAIPWECPVCHEQRRLGLRVRRGRYRGWCSLCANHARIDASTAAVSARKRRARADRTCQGCGATFTPARADGRYCCGACRQAAYRARRKQPAP
jgi:hypothetical protein